MFGFRRKLAGATLTIALSLFAMVPSAQAASLRIGLAADVSSLDPHYLNIAPNVGMSAHFFDALVNIDANGQLIPGLATAWRAVDATTWEFTLRRGVKFHDGSEFTAEDVIFSLDRPATLTRSPGPFTAYTKQIVAKQIVDPYTVRLKTATPYGPMALDVSAIYIVSKKAAQQATTADFNSGKALIGTGPYKLARFRRGDRIEVVRNDDYWGAKSDWDKVTFRIIASSASRLAALLSGDVDAIEAVPTADLSRLRRSDKFRFAQKISWRTIFWHVDQRAAPSPYVTDLAGKPLATNPLQDVRVRKAISLAINRKALVERTMEGLAVPASNIVAPGLVGYNAALPVDTYDPEAARKLLAEAGYPDGFAMTIHGPNDRYINDEQVVQTMAQFLNRIGIRTRVETLPLSVYFARARKGEFSMALLGWGTLAGDFGLRTLVGTPNPAIGWGTWNWGKYSNPEVDKLIAASLGSVDQGKRNGFAQQAMALALTQYAVVPLHHQYATWGMRQGLTYTARTDEFTFAHQFRAVKEGE
ncbi:ABC transporter substrate-binding protein [uncultured Oxalicibacterium sp.]|uniref:ABC transporter substrate-binding protein n=1 Tax=uncultured Oxalicibacterium sp. TaxID=1168540 RepID=UPI0025DDA865|nr:ABC transporter substrate-binding protein [uncultured Oxalicibacterium sp.]